GGETYPPANNYTLKARYTNNIGGDKRSTFGFRIGRNYVKPGYVAYMIEAKQGSGGTLSVSKDYAKKGEAVTVKVSPNSGYSIDELVVYTSDGNKLALPRKGGEFIMPDEAVVVEASFTKPRADGMVKVTGAVITEPVDGSEIYDSQRFRNGEKYVIPDLWVCDHEVTQAEYEKYMGYHKNEYGDVFAPGEWGTENSKGSDYPAYFVNWFDAILYCNLRSMAEGLTPVYYMDSPTLETFFGNDIKKASDPKEWMKLKDDPVNVWDTEIEKTSDGKYVFTNTTCFFAQNEEADGYRLPTEGEWEYIAQGGNGGFLKESYRYAGSNNIDDVTYTDGNAHKIKGKKPNALGIYDLTGNILEWVFSEARGRTKGGSFDVFRTAKLQGMEPIMDSLENNAVLGSSPTNFNYDTGFRVVRTRFR
ncbi:MAG: SUMF1/EgtB/PvdO family nonheme iron enzyme, partial [Treponema sp.]|nr:SUMF1/EgtB/PvdO family nonheme iron enzyme [Treponema sp.]